MAQRIEGLARAVAWLWTTALALFTLYLMGYLLAETYELMVLAEDLERIAIVDSITRLLY